ncbi:hypothetical protein [Massilia sp. S19_KUP03_FR1]|uniref:hypothetical protein n=1 Tax=Massilia sp. S19_KUP03_FR1 TaxID=3025503 RepID=UPI002FCDB83C
MTTVSATVLLLAICGHGVANIGVVLEKGMPFTQVRKQLLDQRWKPVRSQQTEHLAVDRALLERHIVEVESCTVDSFCIFRYTKGTKCLKVVAQGETLPGLLIVGWDMACPSKKHAAK